MECWRYISEFHKFQESVLRAQQQLNGQVCIVGEPMCSSTSVYNKPGNSANLYLLSEVQDEIIGDLQSHEMAIKSEREDEGGGVLIKKEFELYSSEPDQNLEDTTNSRLTSYDITLEPSTSYMSPYSLSIKEELVDLDATKETVNTSNNGDDDYDALISTWRPSLACILCCSEFPNFAQLFKHFQMQHSSENCHIICCEQKLYSPSEVVQHITTYHRMEESEEEQGFKCNKCCKVFTSQRLRDNHMDIVHYGQIPKTKPLNCTQCGKQFLRKSYLLKHMHSSCSCTPENNMFIKEEESLTTANYPTTSLYLNEPMTDSEISQESELSSQDEERNELDITSDNELPELIEDYDKFIAKWRLSLECSQCHATFSNFTLLQQHFEKQHLNERCHIVCCGRKFCDRNAIVQHIIRHKEKKGFKCYKCSKTFLCKYRLRNHVEIVHFGIRTKCEPVKCLKCGNTFQQKAYLARHIQFYCKNDLANKTVKEKPHICYICGKSFAVQKYMQAHIKTVHAESSKLPYKCSVCNKGFPIPARLNRHMAKHSNERIACPYCPKKYLYHGGLYDHIKCTHPKEWEESKRQNPPEEKVVKTLNKCTLCPKQFDYPSQLKRHLKTSHKIETDEGGE